MEQEQTSIGKKDDGFLALAILVGALVLTAIIGFMVWRNSARNKVEQSWKKQTFTPPPERETYLAAKKQLDVSKVSQKDELKKCLMKRALHTIPILLSLQNEGSSIERLYQRGMLTDDMHFKVKDLKTFVDKEIQEVQGEADELVDGWGQQIWPQAMQYYQMKVKQLEGKGDAGPQAGNQQQGQGQAPAPEKKEDKKPKKPQKDIPRPETPPQVKLNPEEEAARIAKQLVEDEEKEKNKKKGSAKVAPKKKS